MDTVKARTTRVRLGVDIGKRQDPAALIVTEEQDRNGIDHYAVRLIERLPLETGYPEVSDRIVEVVRNLEDRSRALEPLRQGFPVETWIDATGVGLPVLDLVREAGVLARGVIFTGSDKLTEHPDRVVSMGKSYLVGRLQVLLQANRLHFPVTSEAAALTRELQAYEISVNERAHASFNAPTGKHDDLVIALGLSVGPSRPARSTWSGTWLPQPDEDDWRHPDHVPPDHRRMMERRYR